MFIPQTEKQLDMLLSMHKENQSQPNAIPPEVLAHVNKMIGKKCTIRHTSYNGIVVGPNMSTSMFYNGYRYPVRVKVMNPLDSIKPITFEYSLADVILTGEEQ